MSVSFVFDSCFGVSYFMLAFGSVLIAQLVYKVLRQTSTFDVNLNLPTFISIKNLIDKLASRGLRRLLPQEFDFGSQYPFAESVYNNGIIVYAILIGR